MRPAPLTLLNAFLRGAWVFLIAMPAVAAPEPWADDALPVRDGLGLWLDASRQPQAWAAHAKPILVTNNPIDVCYDASGHHRDVTQPNRPSQPKYVAGAHAAAIRFDGENDFLQTD